MFLCLCHWAGRPSNAESLSYLSLLLICLYNSSTHIVAGTQLVICKYIMREWSTALTKLSYISCEFGWGCVLTNSYGKYLWVVAGLSSELLCGVTFALAVLAFPFLSFLEVSLGTSAMSLWNRNICINPNESNLKFKCLAHSSFYWIQSGLLSFSPSTLLADLCLAGEEITWFPQAWGKGWSQGKKM